MWSLCAFCAFSYTGSIPHSLSPYPSEEEETYFHQVPHHGAPTPPRKLVLKHKGEHSVLLHWLPASVRHEIGDSKTTVIGMTDTCLCSNSY